jgi:arginase
MPIEPIGVPFDGMGRAGGQRLAPAALREAGLIGALTGRDVVTISDPLLPPSQGERAQLSGVLNETALLAMLEALDDRVRTSLADGRFPLIYGADCSVLLSAIPTLRNSVGTAGLLFVDGHEDATMVGHSDSGEVANMEIALLLGWTDGPLPESIRRRRGALSVGGLVMCGARDEAFREPLHIPSIADRVRLLSPDDLRVDLRACASDAVARISSSTGGWWLHVDLDVLATNEFNARGAPGEPQLPGGLTWTELADFLSAALDAGGCRGLSLVIYNPERDPDGSAGQRVVQLVREIAPHFP